MNFLPEVLLRCVGSMLCAVILASGSASIALAQAGDGVGQNESAPLRRAVDVPAGVTRELRDSPSRALPGLVGYLTEQSTNDVQKVRALHDWIALNIGYDVEMYRSGRIRAQSVPEVIRRGKGVCEGYATLMKEMCRLAGVECLMIPGHARGAGYSVFDDERTGDENHAWNVVKIDDRWQLVDVTWDAGRVDGTRFIRAYSSQYFFADPAAFIYSHLPTDAHWQLLDHPVSTGQFLLLPDLQGEYFAWCSAAPDGWTRIMQSSGRTDLTIPVLPHALINAEVLEVFRSQVSETTVRITEVKHPGAAFVQGDGQGMDHVALAFPHEGKFIVRLYAKRRDDPGEYRSIGTLGVVCTGGTTLEFPEQFAGFREHGYRLVAPFETSVTAGVTARFAFSLPGVAKAMLTCGNAQVALVGTASGNFEGELTAGAADDVTLWGALSEEATRYEAILRFPVQGRR